MTCSLTNNMLRDLPMLAHISEHCLNTVVFQGIISVFSILFFFSFMIHKLNSIPGNKDSIVSGLRISIGLLKSSPSVFRVHSEWKTTGGYTTKKHTWSMLYAHMYQVKLFQGAGCVFCLLGVTKWPSKFCSHKNVLISSNLTALSSIKFLNVSQPDDWNWYSSFVFYCIFSVGFSFLQRHE